MMPQVLLSLCGYLSFWLYPPARTYLLQ